MSSSSCLLNIQSKVQKVHHLAIIEHCLCTPTLHSSRRGFSRPQTLCVPVSTRIIRVVFAGARNHCKRSLADTNTWASTLLTTSNVLYTNIYTLTLKRALITLTTVRWVCSGCSHPDVVVFLTPSRACLVIILMVSLNSLWDLLYIYFTINFIIANGFPWNLVTLFWWRSNCPVYKLEITVITQIREILRIRCTNGLL
jgi:hypothetical protein